VPGIFGSNLFTPDGGSVIYQTWSSGPDRIWQVPRAGGPPVALTPIRSDDDEFGDISPDGKWMAFSRTENEVTRIHIVATDNGEARLLTDSASTLPRWSSDGKLIAFSPNRAKTDGILVIGADGKGIRRLSEKGGWPVWWPGGKSLGFQYFAPDGSEEIYKIPFEGGPLKPLSDIKFNGTNHPFDVSRDGALLATSNSVAVSSEIWLVEPKR
jgi:Tol biopolymer transport system component